MGSNDGFQNFGGIQIGSHFDTQDQRVEKIPTQSGQTSKIAMTSASIDNGITLKKNRVFEHE